MRLPALLAAVAVLAVPAASHAATTYDGGWSVEVITDKGSCDRAYRFPVRVENGRITYTGQAATTATGGVTGRGQVKARFVHGQDMLDATGRLFAERGAGSWTSPSRQCSGRWNAERR
jgi:hypothetical protein